MLGTHNCSSNFYATCASWKLVSSAFFQITSFALLFRMLGCNFFNFFIDASLSYDLCNKCKANLWPFKQKRFQRLFFANFFAIFCGFEVRKIDFRRENWYFYPLKIELWCLGKKWIWPKYQNPNCLLDLFFRFLWDALLKVHRFLLFYWADALSKKPRFLKLRTGFVVVTDWSVPLRPSAWKASSGPNCK